MNTSAVKPKSIVHTRWALWAAWVGASTLGLLLAFAILYLGIFLGNATVPGFNEDRLSGILMFPVLGASLGTAQWLVLRRLWPRAGWWILVTLLGMLGAVFLLRFAYDYFVGSWEKLSGGDIRVIALWSVTGALIGLAQMPVIHHHLRYPWLWVLANGVGWLATGWIIGESINNIYEMVVLGAVPAFFTGLALAWLLRAPEGL